MGIDSLASSLMQRLDANGDGSIDLSSEIGGVNGAAGSGRSYGRDALLRQADTNGDGKVSMDELQKQLQSMDTNGDGKVSRQEFRAALQNAMQNDPSTAGSSGAVHGHRHHHHHAAATDTDGSSTDTSTSGDSSSTSSTTTSSINPDDLAQLMASLSSDGDQDGQGLDEPSAALSG
jgi:hypothetical protein